MVITFLFGSLQTCVPVYLGRQTSHEERGNPKWSRKQFDKEVIEAKETIVYQTWSFLPPSPYLALSTFGEKDSSWSSGYRVLASVPGFPRNANIYRLHNFNICVLECGSLGTRLTEYDPTEQWSHSILASVSHAVEWSGSVSHFFFCAYPVWVYVVGDRWPHNLRGEKHLLFYTLQSLSVRSVQVPILAIGVPAKSPCWLRGVVNL